MKLAEALSLRKDLQKRIEQLKSRILNNVKTQEGDDPTEQPEELIDEMDRCLKQLQKLIFQINVTNMHTICEGRTLTEMMAEKDVLTKRIQLLRDIFNEASSTQNRYSRTEIKYVTNIDVKTLGKKIDKLAKQLREADIRIQGVNFNTELEEA